MGDDDVVVVVEDDDDNDDGRREVGGKGLEIILALVRFCIMTLPNVSF